MITSRLTTKAQTTIPQPIRIALGVKPGDHLAYVIQEGAVLLTRHTVTTADDPFALFSEWDSEADAEVYAAL